MAAISRRWRGGRIYNNTRARVLLWRKCVNPRRLHKTFSAKSLRPPPHSDTLFPSIFSLPSRTDARPPTSQHIPRRRSAPAPAQRHALPAHFHSPRSPNAHPPTSQHIPHRRSAPAPAQRRALPEHFLTPSPPRRTPAGCAMHFPPTAQPIPRRRPSLAPHSDTPFPSTSAPPRSADVRPQCAMHSPPTSQPIPHRRPSPVPRTATRPPRALPLPHAAPTYARRLRYAFPADRTTLSPQRHAASPSVPLRAQKNGTAQCMCDAECLGRPSLRSVIWVGEPRAVRRRCGALACRRGA